MAWPFSTFGAPTLDTGTGVAVPTVATAITASVAWVLGAHFINTSASERTVTVTDTAGNLITKPITIPSGASWPEEWPFRPVTGVKWSADGTGVVGHLWGYV